MFIYPKLWDSSGGLAAFLNPNKPSRLSVKSFKPKKKQHPKVLLLYQTCKALGLATALGTRQAGNFIGTFNQAGWEQGVDVLLITLVLAIFLFH